MGKNSLDQDAHDYSVGAERPRDARPESEFVSAKELLALTRKRGAVLTEADARAMDEIKKL